MLKLFLIFAVAQSVGASFVFGYDAARLTVKVESKVCDGANLPFSGTGFLFKHGDRRYVITSEHVVLHGASERYCHRIYNQHIDQPATLKAVDWAYGLALLSIDHADKLDIPLLSELLASTPKADENVTIAGYAAQSSDLVIHQSGQILSTQSDRHFLPSLQSVYELVNAHGEFGFSGGAVLNKAHSEVVGILSHQYLTPTTGLTQITTLTDQSAIQRHLLVIPWKQVRSWLLDVLDHRTFYVPVFTRDPDQQVLGKTRILSSQLAFSAEELPEQYCTDRSLKAPGLAGIGGGDPSGAGGNDQVSDKPRSLIQVVIEFDQGQDQARWVNAPQQLLHKLTRHLTLGADIKSPFLVYREPKQKNLYQVCVRSLEEYFRKLNIPGVQPVFVQSGGVNGVATTQALETLRGHTGKSVEIALALVDQTQALEAKFHERIKLIQHLIESDSWMILQKADFEYLLDHDGAFHQVWTSMYGRSFDDTVKLVKTLTKAEKSLEALIVR